MASTYRRVRAAKAARIAKGNRTLRSIGVNMAGASGLISLAGAPMIGGAVALVGIGLWGLSARYQGKFNRDALRTATVARLIGSAQVAKRQGAAASIARARGTLAKTAAARSAAASRAIVPRPVGQRRRDNSQKRGDGQTEGYYRTQAGKRVFVRGYATPSR